MTALILTTIAIAILSAWYDKVSIAGGHEIMHVPRWLIRAALVTLAAFVFGHPWMLLGLWGLFSAVFRFALNRWRGLDWRYLSPSSWYDWTFIWIGSLPGRGFYVSALWDNEARKTIEAQWGTVGYHAGWEPYVRWAHRGGTLAYIVEVVAFVVVAYICG